MNTKISAKDFFLQVGAIAAFYTSVIALIMLLFRVINVAYPPVLRSAIYPGSSTISFQVATLIVAFPIFILLSWIIQKNYVREPALKEVSLRKWLAYITLFIAGIVIAGDLITILYSYLDGQDLTKSFLLKFLVLLVIAGGVFGYYLREIRNMIGQRERSIWRVASSAIVLASIILGFAVVGSPSSQRAFRNDEQRLMDLQNIQWQIINYYQQKETLPTVMGDLNDSISGWSSPVDPETDQSYEYKRTGDLSFELCATFDRATEGSKPGSSYPISEPMMWNSGENWDHKQGYQCFSRVIDPDFYPPTRVMKGRAI